MHASRTCIPCSLQWERDPSPTPYTLQILRLVFVCACVRERAHMLTVRTSHRWCESMHVLQGCTILYEMCLHEEMYVHTHMHVKYSQLQYIFSHSLISWWLGTYWSLHYANAPPPPPTPPPPPPPGLWLVCSFTVSACTCSAYWTLGIMRCITTIQ